MYTKQMVILAKSYKQGGWCIAGRQVTLNRERTEYTHTSHWIRPESKNAQTHGALTDADCEYEDGSAPKVYDLVELDFVERRAAPGQPENELIANTPWRKLGEIQKQDVSLFLNEPEHIWNEQVGLDYVTAQYVANRSVKNSLSLIRPQNFLLQLSNYYNEFESRFKRELRASFDYKGVLYNHISVTDPAVRYMLKNQFPAEGQETIEMPLLAGDNCYLCMSLGPAFTVQQKHFKLVATIFDFDGYIQRTFG